jgi:hypothetical protein
LGTVLTTFSREPVLCRELDLGIRRLVCGPGSLDPVADKARIEAAVVPLMPWRDKRVTHIDRDEEMPALTWEELDVAIDVVTEVFSLYSSRLTGVNYHVDFSDPGWHQWRTVFQCPLFDARGQPILQSDLASSDD